MSRKLFAAIAALAIAFAGAGAAAAEEKTQTIDLKPGFNFVSFTVAPPATTDALRVQFPAIGDIYSYNAAAGSFLSHGEGTLKSVSTGKGYIISSPNGGTVTLKAAEAGGMGNIPLKAGYNLIGISRALETPKFSEMMNRSPIIDAMYKWNANSGSFIQVSRAGGSVSLVDGVDPTASAGQSYFVRIAADTIMNLEGPIISICSQPVAGVDTTNGFPVTMVNNSGTYKAEEIYLAIIGQDSPGNHYYYDLATKTMKSCLTDTTGASYCFPLASTEAVIGKSDTYRYIHPFVNTWRCRVYVFFKKKGRFSVNNNDPVNGFVEPSHDNESLDKYTIFDKFELTCDDKSLVWLNTTLVDFICVPFNLKFDCDGDERGFRISNASQLYDIFTKRTDGWKSAVIYDSTGNVMRVLGANQSPNSSGAFGGLKTSIDNAWKYYETHEVNFSCGGWTYRGVLQTAENSVYKNSFEFTVVSGQSSVGDKYYISKPDQFVVYKCDGDPLANAGSDARKKLNACIGAAINRGVFCEPDWGNLNKHYVTTGLNAGQYNIYAKLLHEQAIQGRVYAFPYDDTFGLDSTMTKTFEQAKRGVTVTIPAMPALK